MEKLTSNDWSVIYRLVDEYVERSQAITEIPAADLSHQYREQLREKVSQALIESRRSEPSEAEEEERE